MEGLDTMKTLDPSEIDTLEYLAQHSPEMLTEPVSDAEANWVSHHYDELWQQYPGEWIAVANERVIDHNISLVALRDALDDKGIKHPFYEKFPEAGTEIGILSA
jgi:hypothetical protein